MRYTVSATYTGRGYWIGLPSETPGLVLGTIHAIDTTGAAGSFSVAIAGTSSGTTYKICAFKRSGLNPGDYTWGDEIIFTAGNTQPVTYNCLITDDSQINAASYQFSVYIKQTGGTALYLNNYQLGMELNRQDLLDNLYMTGEYVANTCELANLTPAGMTIAFQAAGGGHPYGHMDVRINGLPPSATATLVGTSYKRIGTFIIHNWTSATHTTAKSFGSIQPDLEWDNDFIAKTYIYAYISGASQLITDLNQQITLLTNLAFNSVNWRGISNGDWHENLNWIRNPGLTNTIPASTENVYIPGAPASGTFSSPIVSTSVPLPTCKNLFIGLRTDNNIVKALGNLTINPGGNLTVTGDTLRNLVGTAGLTIGSDATGTGSLIHKTDTVSASIKRYITLNNYHMVSIPDTSASPTSNLFLGSYLYYFDETQITLVDNGWVNMGISTSTPLSQKRGYMIYNPTANTTYTFAGKMNNGSFLPIATFTSGGPRVNQGFNLVPNPYPSAIDWRAALGWAKTNVYDATWIWNPTANNYAAFGADQTINGGTRFIPLGQSFFIQASNTPTFSMTNDVRVHDATTPFYKTTDALVNNLRIKADCNTYSDEIVVRFNDGYSSSFENPGDVQKMYGGEEAPQLSSVSSDNINLCINSMPLTGGEVIVPLNFSVKSATNVTFTATGIETFKTSVPIYLEDQALNKIVNLRSDPVYNFSYSTADAIDRFRLRFVGINGTNELTSVNVKTFISNGKIYIDASSLEGRNANINVYNSIGQLISSDQQLINGVVNIDAPKNSGIYIIDISSMDQHFVTKVFNK